jgi:hypothetical protein
MPAEPTTFRDLTTLEEFADVVRLERDIWGPAYDDVVPVPILAVSVHSGGILIGAFDERRTSNGERRTANDEGRTTHDERSANPRSGRIWPACCRITRAAASGFS